jgi:hypothetical protein
MAQQKIMHWTVPIPSVLIEADAVPPVAVEAAVSEARELREHIEQTLPDDVPGQELLEQHWKEHLADNPGKFLPALIERHARIFLARCFNDHWIYVRLGYYNHHPDDAERRRGFLRYIPPVDTLLTWVFEVVNERWKTCPFDEVCKRQIFWVRIVSCCALSTQLFIEDGDFGCENTAESLDLAGIERLVRLDCLTDRSDFRFFF